jgi:hypothetical protein
MKFLAYNHNTTWLRFQSNIVTNELSHVVLPQIQRMNFFVWNTVKLNFGRKLESSRFCTGPFSLSRKLAKFDLCYILSVVLITNYRPLRFEVITTEKMPMLVFWVVMSY